MIKNDVFYLCEMTFLKVPTNRLHLHFAAGVAGRHSAIMQAQWLQAWGHHTDKYRQMQVQGEIPNLQGCRHSEL